MSNAGSRPGIILAICLAACSANHAAGSAGAGGAAGAGGSAGAGGASGAGGSGGVGGATESRDAGPVGGQDAGGATPGDGPERTLEPSGGCSPDGWCWLRPRPTGNTLASISGGRADDLWAAGEAGTALHWDGTTWTAHNVNGELHDVWSVFPAGPNDAWAIGYDGLFRWDGTTWTRSAAGAPSAIVGTSPDNLWAVSGGYLMLLIGSTWGVMGVADSDCSALFVASPTDIWIGCDTLYHYDGTSFVDTGTVPGAFQLEGSGPSDVWAATLDGVWSWNGTAWAKAGLSTTPIYNLSVRAPGDVWALDHNDVLHHRVGDSWRQTWQGQPSSTRWVWAVGNDVWIAGADGLLLRGDGTTFAPTSDTTISPQVWARAVYGIAPSRVWIATDDGVQLALPRTGRR